MIFFGYWAFWFLLGFILSMFGKMKFTMGNNPSFSMLALIFYAFIMAVPTSIMHCSFTIR